LPSTYKTSKQNNPIRGIWVKSGSITHLIRVISREELGTLSGLRIKYPAMYNHSIARRNEIVALTSVSTIPYFFLVLSVRIAANKQVIPITRAGKTSFVIIDTFLSEG
jgi:hypothetical protein